MLNFIVVASKMWVYSPQNRKKMVIFWYNFADREKYKGKHRNWNISAQLQISLYALTP